MKRRPFSRRLGLAFGAALALFLCAAPAPAQTWTGLRVQGKQIVDQDGKNVVLRGLGPGEWFNIEAYMIKWPDNDKGPIFYGDSLIRKTLVDLMGQSNADEFYRRWEANIIAEADVQKWADWGANSVRLSMNYHWLTTSDGVYLDSGWQRIDRLIAWCKKYGIKVILCLHAAPGSQSGELMSDSAGVPRLWTEGSTYQPWTIHLWQKIAERYAHETTVAGYDLLDEPMPPAGHEKAVRMFYVYVSKAIRSVDPHHILFIEGLEYAGSVKGMQAMAPAWDDNMVFDFHKYWDKNDPASIQGYLQIRDRENRPLWNGESGESDEPWGKDMIALCEKNNIGWSWWTYKKVDSTRQPYTVHAPANYKKILDYVAGKGPKPSQAEATEIMLALADNAATAKCRYNADEVQAIFGGRK